MGSGRGRSRLPVEKPDVGLDPVTLGSRPEPKAGALTAMPPRRPCCVSFYLMLIHIYCLFLLLLPVFLVSYPKKNHCQDQCQGVFFLFCSRSFMMSGLMFKSLFHFELNFVCGVKIVVLFHSFTCGYPVFPTPFI